MLVIAAMLAVVAGGCAAWQSPTPVCLAGAKLQADGCHPQQAQQHHIPFPAGEEVRVTQAYHGYETHRNDVAYAVDFACERGAPVVASRSGVVWSVRDDSTESCPHEECVDDANYVILDHGDGTFSTYYHLHHRGAVVEPGDRVCRGQLLGQCGDTGFATGPHLHFSVVDSRWHTIPAVFEETRDTSAGVLLPRHEYVSQNERKPYCEANDYSSLGGDAFIHRGIELDSEIPTRIRSRDERTTRFEGTYHGDRSHVAVHRRDVNDEDAWIDQCTEVDAEGRFSFEIDWPEQIFEDGYYFLMLTGSDEHCNAPGWAFSYRIRVYPPELPGELQELLP